jgi:hypothetical protein
VDRKRPDLSGQSPVLLPLAWNHLCSGLTAFLTANRIRLASKRSFPTGASFGAKNRVHFSLPRPYTGPHDALEKPSPYPNSGQDKRDGV